MSRPLCHSPCLPFPGSSAMAVLALTLLILALTDHASAAWCVCKGGLSDAVLQKTLDYACGAGADCKPLQQNGPCFNPNTVKAHCSYAVNSYFQKKGQSQGACDFEGTATLSASDPSYSGCPYPDSSSSGGGISTNPKITSPTITTPTRGTNTPYPGTNSPYTATPLGGLGNSLNPPGVGTNTDYSGAGLQDSTSVLLCIVLLVLWVTWA